jgi:hypothetical protein
VSALAFNRDANEHSWDVEGRCRYCGTQSDWILASKRCPNHYARQREEQKAKKKTKRKGERCER